MARGDTPIDRRKFIGGTATGLAAGLAGCDGDSGPGDETDQDQETDAGTQTATATQGAPTEGGTVVLGQANDLQSYNVLVSGNFYGLVILTMLYDTGLRADPVTSRPIPGVFQDWEINIDNFGTDSPAVTGTMIEGHTWHDGEEVTAGDVAFTHNYLEEQDASGSYQTPAYFEGVEADSDDGYTVSWYFSRVASDAFLAGPGTIIIPEHIWSDVADHTQYNPRAEGELIGSGPFEIGETNDGEFYELNMRPKEEIPWNGMEEYSWLHPDGPFIDGIRFEIFQSGAGLFQAILDGEVNLSSEPGQTLDQAVQATQQENLRIIESGTPGWEMHCYNLRRVPFDDVAFRQFLHKCYNQRWTVETQMQNIGGDSGEYLMAKPWEFWRPPEVADLLEDADSDDPYAPTTYVNEQIADEDIVEPVDVPDLKYPTGSAEWPAPDQETVDQLRDFLLNHPKATHDYTLGEAASSGMDSIDGQEIYVNGQPLGTAHTNNDGQPGEGPIEFMDFPPNIDPQAFERITKWIQSVQAAGVPTTRDSRPWAQIQPYAYQEENHDIFRQGWPARLWHATHLVWMLSGVGDTLDLDSTDGSTNWNGAGYTGADEIIGHQDRFVDPATRQPWVKQALAQIYHDQPQSVEVYNRELQVVDREFDGWVREVGGIYGEPSFLNVRLADGGQ